MQGDWVVARELLILIALVMSGLLISPIRMFALKFKGFGWSGNQLRYLFILSSAILLILLRGYAVPIIILLYIIISFVRWAVCSRCRKA